MTKTEILQRDNPILRQIAKIVPIKTIQSKKIQNILNKMKRALHAEPDGAAIAAPQIGENLRIFVVNGEIIANAGNDLVFINPEIVKTSQKKKKMEEGCLSVRWLYGRVARSEKVTLRALSGNGEKINRGASGLLAQIFQHEVDHLNGILFTDKAEDLRDLPPAENIRFVFFGSSKFSKFVLDELKQANFAPLFSVTSAKESLPLEKLQGTEADLFIIASFGKILPKEILDIPKKGVLNVHPSLLPELRGPSPIQETIIDRGKPGVTIMKLDEKMDHGPILAQVKMNITPWPDHYHVVEEKLGRAGGRLLGAVLPKWIKGGIKEIPQDDALATYTKLIKKEDGLLNLDAPAEENLRKVFAYSTWPNAYMFFKNKNGKEIRVVIKEAKVEDGKFIPTRVIPAGKREMNWQDFLRGNS